MTLVSPLVPLAVMTLVSPLVPLDMLTTPSEINLDFVGRRRLLFTRPSKDNGE